MSMLKGFFGGSSAPAQDKGDITPRAPTQGGETPNPFDSWKQKQASFSSGLRTPTTGKFPLSSHGSSTSLSTYNTDPLATPGPSQNQVPVTPGGRPTTAVTTAEPNFEMRLDPAALAAARRKEAASASGAAAGTGTGTGGLNPKGKLTVKLIEARHIASPSPHSKPYAVVVFDGNEFVSREPIGAEGEEAVGVAVQLPDAHQPRTPRRESPPATNDAGTPKDAPLASPGILNGSGLSKALGEHSKANPPSLAPLDTSNMSASLSAQDATTPTASTPSQQQFPTDVCAYNPTWKHEVVFDVMNEKSVIDVQIFERTVEEEAFLGMCEIRPRLVNGHTVDQWFKLQPHVYHEEEHVTGEIRIQIRYDRHEVKSALGVNDFDFLRMIGKGTFGRVFQVRKKDTKRIYAMKVLSKSEIVAKKEVAHTIGERKILQRSSECPFLLGLKFSFQSERDLYLVMDFKSGGELFHHLQKEGRFTEDRARFYTAEIVLAFEHLHKYDIVYRDLKPENILLDATGHIVLCDFGLSKPDLPKDALTNTFCGTTEYLAPEVLLDDNGYSKLVDFWSLGVLLFEMCCGWSPFYAEDTQQMYKLICFGKVKFPRGVIGEDGKQFVKGLLCRNPKHRLGAERDAEELKEHPFFSSIDWDALNRKDIPPPFKPAVESDESVSNFDPEFTEANLFEEAPDDVTFDDDDPSPGWLHKASLSRSASQRERDGSGAGGVKIAKPKRPAPQPSGLSESVQENFRGFTFSGESMIHHAGLPKMFASTKIHDETPTVDVTMHGGEGEGMERLSRGWDSVGEEEGVGRKERGKSDVSMQ